MLYSASTIMDKNNYYTKDHEDDDTFKREIERRVRSLEKRLEFLEEIVEVQQREYKNV